jgi:hypothetical protein
MMKAIIGPKVFIRKPTIFAIIPVVANITAKPTAITPLTSEENIVKSFMML